MEEVAGTELEGHSKETARKAEEERVETRTKKGEIAESDLDAHNQSVKHLLCIVHLCIVQRNS